MNRSIVWMFVNSLNRITSYSVFMQLLNLWEVPQKEIFFFSLSLFLYIDHLLSFIWLILAVFIFTDWVGFPLLLLSCCNSGEGPPGGTVLDEGPRKDRGLGLSQCQVNPGAGRGQRRK